MEKHIIKWYFDALDDNPTVGTFADRMGLSMDDAGKIEEAYMRMCQMILKIEKNSKKV